MCARCRSLRNGSILIHSAVWICRGFAADAEPRSASTTGLCARCRSLRNGSILIHSAVWICRGFAATAHFVGGCSSCGQRQRGPRDARGDADPEHRDRRAGQHTRHHEYSPRSGRQPRRRCSLLHDRSVSALRGLKRSRKTGNSGDGVAGAPVFEFGGDAFDGARVGVAGGADLDTGCAGH
jgi:hypothetical protein